VNRVRKRLTARWLLFGLASVVAVAVTANATLDADPGLVQKRNTHLTAAGGRGERLGRPPPGIASASPPCASASAPTIASVDATAARGIYASELHGTEVKLDVARITGSPGLLSALASHNEPAIYAAVHALVYAPHWHIVRLRVARAGRVLADVGGPHVIAPVSGELQWRGKTVGTYVMSVQDDVGYVKLVRRFIGVPVDLYTNGSFLIGALQPAPTTLSTGSSASVGGDRYMAQVFGARAFPSGTLRVALLVKRPTSAVAAKSCPSVRLAAWGSVATHIAGLFKTRLPSHYSDLVGILQATTGGRAYVRAGSTQLAGGIGPSRIPSRGILRYRNRVWSVFSWEPVPHTRVYLLTPSA
jgi:hypothetical protein